jgi:pimeloyl-ACP methyl ester carboxylesterase
MGEACMQTFELIFIISSLISMIFFKWVPFKKNNVISLLIIVSLSLHIVLEHVRYELILFLFGYILFLLPIKSFKKIRMTLSILIVFVSTSLFLAFPIYQMPTPSGPYTIGTQTFEVFDDSRDEIYGDLGTRAFNYQIWYPGIADKDATRAPWLLDQEITSQALSRDFGFPGFLLNQTKFVSSHSYLNLKLEDDKTYPIIIISHGWSGSKYLHSDLGESLASEGFIAVSIDHTYSSVATRIGDQRIFKQNDALTGFDDNTLGLKSNTRLMMTYGLDISKTIDHLTLFHNDETSPFYAHLDLDNIGVVGHSTGGGGAIYASLIDSRIQALIGLDAWVEPIEDILSTSQLSIPSLFLRSESWETGPNNDVLLPMLRTASNATLYQVKGTSHYDFVMVYMYTSLSKVLGFSGPIDTQTMLDVLFKSQIDFFSHHLKGELYEDVLESFEVVSLINMT